MLATTAGFAGGHTEAPTYKQVCAKKTGHAEAVRVVYDLRKLSTRRLLTEFFTLHDFTADRRENGGQYRSAIFPDGSFSGVRDQENTASDMLAELAAAGYPPATELRRIAAFYPAESRHQQYCSARGIMPKKRAAEKIREILTN